MASGDDASTCRKYGVPLYGAAWVPYAAGKKDSSDESEASAVSHHVVLAGGGGEGRSGIPNAILVSKFDFGSNSLSDRPVSKLGTDDDLPYRIAVHPGGEGVMCSLPKSCRWYEWDLVGGDEERLLALRSSEKVLKQLEDVGQQLSMTFNNVGNLLAVGGEDGKLRVFNWPSMEITLNEANAHASVKDLDFSPNGKLLVSVGSGPGKVWDVEKSVCIASLPKENDEVFGYCRFSRAVDTDQVLYITSMQDKGGSIVKWNATTWKKIISKFVVRDPVSAFNVSPDGKYLAIGTIQGDILIISSINMRVKTTVRKAHLGLVTALAFSLDSRALVSASLDSSARVTPITDAKKEGSNIWIIMLIVFLAMAVYYARSNDLLPLKF